MEFRRNLLAVRALYLVWVILGMLSILYIPSQLIDFNDALLTAEQISKDETLFRAGIIGRLFTQLLFLIIVWYLYQLFNSVNRKATYLMMIFTFVSVPIAMYNEMNALMALNYLEQPDTLMIWLSALSHGIILVSLFWGLWLFPLGYLVYKSNWFPRFMGIALFIGGLGYFLGTCFRLVFPETDLLHTVFETLTMGEMVWVLWIIFLGVRKKNWPEGVK